MLSSLGKNAMLTGFGSAALYASLHTDVPNTSGSNELTGGGYARVATTWGIPSAGKAQIQSFGASFNVPASTVLFIGFWSAATGGSFLGYAPINSDLVGQATQSYSTANYFNTSLQATNSLIAGDRIQIMAALDDSVPINFTSGNMYYVINVSGASGFIFQLSATSGGSPITWGATQYARSVTYRRIIPVVFASAQTYLPAGVEIRLEE